MDVEKKTEDSLQNDTEQEEERAVSEAATEDSSNKRKLEDDGDSEDTQNVKKMKVDEEEKEEGADGGEESAEKGETADETEGDKDTKPDEKLSSPAAVVEEVEKGDKDGGDKDRESEAAEPSQQQEEAMEVEESTAEKDKEQPEEKEKEEEEKAPSTEKADTSEEGKEEVQESKIETAESNEGPESEKEEEKSEMVQRRYPMRHRRGEDKGASQSAKANSSASEMKPGSGREDVGHENDSTRAGSVKSDSGSDKENLNSDAAGDVSNAGTPDVIMLSEEEETEQWKEMKAKKRKQVRRLQAHLRNEEAKLVLLKKLRQSQLTPQVQDHTPVPNSTNSQLAKQATPRQQGGPPPLVRGNQQVRGSNLHLQQQQQQNRLPSQGQMRNIQGPPPLVNPRMGSSNTANGHSSQNLRNNTPHLNQHGSSSLRPTQQQPQSTPQHQQAATPPQVDTQTPAQRQAAAKLALRKQLEKTLLQIPPPKPPAPEMNFIPSLACPDFVLLLGLEEVVNHIIDLQLIARGQKSPDEKFICNPFTCVQCNTDYTPVWKREKPGSKNVICEHCVTWNQKRALKQEHTNRLKSAFVKALQQEQEIERMQAQTPSNPSTPTPSGTPPSSASSSGSSQTLAAAAAASNVAAAAAMSMNPASFRHSAEQVRQHHNFLQAQAQLRAGQSLPGLQGFGARSAFPYNLPYVKQADLQRQYLLDLMPRTGGMPWKQ